MREIGVEARERVYFIAEPGQLIGALDHLRVILLRTVRLIVKRIDIGEQIGIRILRHKIIQALEQGRRSLLCRAGLLGVVFRLRVLRPLGRPGVLTRCRCLRECAQPDPRHQEKSCDHREPGQSSCCVHSHVSSLKLQA